MQQFFLQAGLNKGDDAVTTISDPNADIGDKALALAEAGVAMSIDKGKGATIKEQALSIKAEVNANSVSIRTPDQVIHYDLEGASHKGVETPHVQRSTYNTNPNTGETFVNKDRKSVRPMTQQDIRTVMNYLNKLKK